MGDLERTARFLVKCFVGFLAFYFVVNLLHAILI